MKEKGSVGCRCVAVSHSLPHIVGISSLGTLVIPMMAYAFENSVRERRLEVCRCSGRFVVAKENEMEKRWSLASSVGQVAGGGGALSLHSKLSHTCRRSM